VETTGLPKASTHRLLQELVELSALTLDEQTRRYRGGLLLARIGASVTANYDLRDAVRPFLTLLHDEFGYVATLGLLNDVTGTYIDKIEASGFGPRPHSEVGKSFPLHCTAIDNEEITRGFVCIAAPVFGADGHVAGAMSCTLPSYVRQERGIQVEIDAVCRLARQASEGSLR
jgi:DNA-binding IclR family transcriptional regulator